MTVVNQLVADYEKEPVVEKETEKQRRSDVGNKEFYKNMFSGKGHHSGKKAQGRNAQQTFKKVYETLGILTNVTKQYFGLLINHTKTYMM